MPETVLLALNKTRSAPLPVLFVILVQLEVFMV